MTTHQNPTPSEYPEFDLQARLTAYALGELDDADRPEIERILERDALAREHVAETRAVAERLKREFDAEPAPALSDQQRDAVLRDGTAVGHRPRTLRRVAMWGGGLAAAAALALLVTLPMLPNAARHAADEVAIGRPEAESAPEIGRASCRERVSFTV